MNTKRKRTIFFLVVSLFHMAASFAHPVTPTIFKDLNLSSYMFGVALAAMMFVNFLFSPFWGKINTYISSKRSMFISGLGYALGQLLFGLAKTELAFIGARMFAGIFTGGAFVSMLTYIVNTTTDPKERGTNLTIYATLQGVCGAFGYFIGGLIGNGSPYIAVGAQVVTLALCGVLFLFICDDDKKVITRPRPMQLVKEANPFKAFADSRHFMTAMLAVLFAMCALQNLGATAFDQTFNYYIKDVFNFPSSYNGLIKGAMGLITLVANSTICMWLIHKTNVRKSIIGVLILCSSTMMGALLFDNVVPFVILNVVFFAFNGISVPILQDMVAQKAKGENSNLVMGFYNSMKSLGGIVGALFSGLLYAANPQFPFIMGFVAFLLATLFSVMYAREKAQK